MKKIKVIILDFDGLLVESVDIKDNAFAVVFSEFPDHLDEIMKYHYRNNTIIRYVKFKHIVENIIKKEYTKELEEKIVSHFTAYTRTEIIKCPYVNGALEFLDFFHANTALYLASATPEDELRLIVRERKIEKFFKNMYGSPEKKVHIFEKIRRLEKVEKDEMVFLGDSNGDMKAANDFGISFVGRNNKDDFSQYTFPKFKDLFEIKNYLHSKILLENSKI